MFVSTGITTLGFSASILFSQEVQLSATELAGAVAVSFVSGGLSAAGFLQLVRRYGRNIRGKWVLVALVGVSCAIPLWAFFALDTTVEAFLVTILLFSDTGNPLCVTQFCLEYNSWFRAPINPLILFG